MDRAQILRRLEAKLLKAREWRDRARREFDTNLSASTGIPHTCGGLALRDSSREYRRAIRAANRVFQQQTSFIVKGAIPDDLNADVDEN